MDHSMYSQPIIYHSFVDLLKVLTPHEYNNYLMKNGIRQNTRIGVNGQVENVNRANTEHRYMSVKRDVLSQKKSKTQLSASNVVSLGVT